jgi:O-antigen biosynthesis protein
MKARDSGIRIAVLGETLDDLLLMRFGNVFVSGAVEPADLKRLIRQYRINAVFTGFGAPLFGHPLGDGAIQCDVPTAYIDWSFGACRPVDGDLPIDPSLSPRQAAAALAHWAEAQCN